VGVFGCVGVGVFGCGCVCVVVSVGVCGCVGVFGGVCGCVCHISPIQHVMKELHNYSQPTICHFTLYNHYRTRNMQNSYQ